MMAYDEKKRKAEKTVVFSMRLQKSTDADILEYLAAHEDKAAGISRQGLFKKALREYMENHKD